MVSPIIGQQMQWSHRVDYCVASHPEEMAEHCIQLYSDAELWERVRANSLARAKAELSPAAFANSLRVILEDVTASRRNGYGAS